MGVPLLYPKPTKWHLLPGCLRIVTGSAGEEVVFVLAATFALMLFNVRRSYCPLFEVESRICNSTQKVIVQAATLR
jgi:hypothetical protein